VLFHAVADVIECGQIFAKWKILPEAGGWIDQSVEWRHDLLTYTSHVAWEGRSKGDEED
jgi:hypothetical protein